MNTAVITGASSGLGREIFHAVIKEHPEIDDIWVIARRKERLEALAAETNVNVTVLPLDVTDENEIAAYGKLLAERKPSIKLLVNSAGAGTIGNVWELDPVRQGRDVTLNCRALTEICAMTVPYIQKGGAIINICSIAGFCPNPRMTTYSSTKAYVFSFSKGLRFELKQKGINCLAVCPCPMETEFLEKGAITGKSKAFDSLPRCNPEKVASASLKKAFAGRGVYTPKLFYKFYRLIAKVLPHGIVMHMGKL